MAATARRLTRGLPGRPSDPAALGALAAVAALLATAVVLATPDLRFAYRNPDLHLALVTGESLIALLAAFLALGRARRRRCSTDLLICCALALLALTNLLFSTVPAVLSRDTTTFATWASVAGRLLGAAVLAAGALVPRTAPHPATERTARALLAVVGALAIVAAAVLLLEDRLPHGVGVHLTAEGSGAPRLDAHWAILAAQLTGLALFAVAAAGFLHRARATDDRMLGWLGVAASIAAVGRLNDFLYPSLFTAWVSVGDVLRLGFYLVILVAAAAEIHGYWESAARAAALEERRRIARDLHDGLAQELASVARNLYWLDQDDRFVQRARASAERALAGSRRAIAALTESSDQPLADALRDALRAVADRESTRLVLSLAPQVRVSAAQRDALVMIASEAITNAARHGAAELVRVQLIDDPPRLRIGDAGRGFDPAGARPRDGHGFGLVAMRERAEAVGARLRVDSRPGGGTTVEVAL